MTYLFTPPTASDTPRLSYDRGVDHRADRLMRHVRQPPRGRHVVRESGVWSETDTLTTARESAADAVLYGGHETPVSDAYAAELISQGFGENLTNSLLASAVLDLNAATLPSDWVDTDGWANAGTLGSVLDASKGDFDSTLEGYGTADVGVEAPAINPLSALDHCFSIDHHTVFDVPLTGARTWAKVITPLDIGPISWKLCQKYPGSALPTSGEGWVAEYLLDGDDREGLVIATFDGTNFRGAYSGPTLTNDQKAVVVWRTDRDTERFDAWADGVQAEDYEAPPELGGPFILNDLTALGDSTTTADFHISKGWRYHRILLWDTALTDSQIETDLPIALGA